MSQVAHPSNNGSAAGHGENNNVRLGQSTGLLSTARRSVVMTTRAMYVAVSNLFTIGCPHGQNFNLEVKIYPRQRMIHVDGHV